MVYNQQLPTMRFPKRNKPKWVDVGASRTIFGVPFITNHSPKQNKAWMGHIAVFTSLMLPICAYFHYDAVRCGKLTLEMYNETNLSIECGFFTSRVPLNPLLNHQRVCLCEKNIHNWRGNTPFSDIITQFCNMNFCYPLVI
jgi:hypothetical protein